MTKLLLISDTHGNLKIINELVHKTGCDAVIHAGDFGFYDDESVDRLSDREVMLSIKHSALDPDFKKGLLNASPQKHRDYIRNSMPLSDLPLFLSRQVQFKVPVYAVWGNHEDTEIVKKLWRGDLEIENLNVLHEKQSFHFGGVHIFGLGGNFLVGKKLFQMAIAGLAGKVWSTLPQYRTLLDHVSEKGNLEETRVFVTHVSPEMEPFMTLLAAHLGSHINVSGHMGFPETNYWVESDKRSFDSAKERLMEHCRVIEKTLKDSKGISRKGMKSFMKEFRKLPDSLEWYDKMLNVNLPDVVDGYAVLEIDGEGQKLTTFSSTV